MWGMLANRKQWLLPLLPLKTFSSLKEIASCAFTSLVAERELYFDGVLFCFICVCVHWRAVDSGHLTPYPQRLARHISLDGVGACTLSRNHVQSSGCNSLFMYSSILLCRLSPWGIANSGWSWLNFVLFNLSYLHPGPPSVPPSTLPWTEHAEGIVHKWCFVCFCSMLMADVYFAQTHINSEICRPWYAQRLFSIL